MRKLTGFTCALLLLTGCPEPPVASRTVSLGFPVPAGQTKVSTSVKDSEVREAMKVIDSVLTSYGFVRDKNPDMGSAPGFVASYSKFNEESLRLFVFPIVYLKGDRLEVVCSEGRRPGGRLSPATNKMLTSLQKDLSNRFGSQNVRLGKAE